MALPMDPVSRPAARPRPSAYARQTLLRLPIVTGIYPDFSVCVTKPFCGLASASVNDENDQTLHAPEQDSFFDDLSENDVWNLPASQDSLELNVVEEYEAMHVLVRTLSVSVAGIEYALSASVLASEVIAGPDSSLLLSLLLGYVILVRIWKVPPQPTAPNSSSLESHNSGESTFAPRIVQWWKLRATEPQNALSVPSRPPALPADASCNVAVHEGGLAACVVLSSVLRLHSIEQTSAGIQFLPHFNVPVEGVVLHACFALPLASDPSQISLMTLVLSNSRRLELSLYTWYALDLLTDNLKKVTLPLTNTFPFPVLVVPLHQAFLFVCPDEFIVVTLNNVWSADYSFSKYAYDGSFPTAFSRPAAPRLLAVDEVILASDSGVFYSVIVSSLDLSCIPILRIADPVSVFALHELPDKHESSLDMEDLSLDSHDLSSGKTLRQDREIILSYASDTGGAKQIHVPKPVRTADSKVPYSDVTVLQDYRSWAPIVDVAIIDGYLSREVEAVSRQEFWALTGMGKRTKLSQLLTGYSVRPVTKCYDSLRKAEVLLHIDFHGRPLLLCSLPFSSSLLEYDPESDPPFLEVEGLVSDFTLCAALVPDSNILVQVTRNCIRLINFETSAVSDYKDINIVLACSYETYLVLVFEVDGTQNLQTFKVGIAGDSFDVFSHLAPLSSITISSELSFVKTYVQGSKVLIFCGSYDGSIGLLVYDTETDTYSEVFLANLQENLDSKTIIIPHDCAYSSTTQKVSIGSKTGHYVEVTLKDLDNENHSICFGNLLQIGTAPVTITPSSRSPYLFAVCRSTFIIDAHGPRRLSFGDKTHRNVNFMLELPGNESQYAFARDDGLIVGTVSFHEVPMTRQISIGEAAKKLLFLDSSGLFVLLCKSKKPSDRVKFVDRKSIKPLATIEVHSKLGSARESPIFMPLEIPICGHIWHILRQDRVLKKVIVGSLLDGETGSFKILDVAKVLVEGYPAPMAKVSELVSISLNRPVTAIEQIDSTIFFACENEIFATSYSFENRRLCSVIKVGILSSEIVALSRTTDNLLLVSTSRDSLFAFKYDDIEAETAMYSEDSESRKYVPAALELVFKDPLQRSLINSCKMGETYVAGDKLHSSLIFLDPSDPQGGPLSSYKLSMIPRIYSCNFSAPWARSEDQMCVVGVNGEIMLFTAVEKSDFDSEEHGMDGSFTLLYDILDRPFADKITGKGLFDLYKPFFGQAENKGKLVDLDLKSLAAKSKASPLL